MMDTLLSWLPLVGMTYWALGIFYWIVLFERDLFEPHLYSYKEILIYSFLSAIEALIVATIWPFLAYQLIKENSKPWNGI